MPEEVWREATEPPGADRDWVVGTLGVGADPRGHRGEPGAPGRAFRRLEERGVASTRRAGWSGPWSGCARPDTSTSSRAPRGSGPPRSGTKGPGRSYRSTGEPTYFAADIGYVAEKFSRGFDQPHLRLGCRPPRHRRRVATRREAMGFDKGRRGDAPGGLGALRARRPGGLDEQARRRVPHARRAARGGRRRRRALVVRSRAPSTPIDFDIELAKKQSAKNPVYYVQYAHARICSILRKATDAGLTRAADRLRRPRRRPGARWPGARAPAPARGRGGAAASGETQGVTAYARSWRRPSTPTTATAAWSTRTSRHVRAGASRSSTPRAWPCATRWPSWASRRPSRCAGPGEGPPHLDRRRGLPAGARLPHAERCLDGSQRVRIARSEDEDGGLQAARDVRVENGVCAGEVLHRRFRAAR